MRLDLSLLGLMLLIGTAGCVSQTIPIVEDSSESSTKVRFVSSREMGWINLYPETDCNNGALVVFDNAVDNFIASLSSRAPKRIGMIDPPDPNSREAAEYSFKGGQTLNIAVTHFPGRCLGGLSFRTEPGSQYEIVLVNNTSNGCVFKISQLSMLNGAPHREPVKKIAPLICK